MNRNQDIDVRQPFKGTNKTWSVVVGIFIFVTGIFLLIMIFKVWPTLIEANNEKYWQIEYSLLYSTQMVIIKGEPCFIILVIISGFLGSFIHIASSFIAYAGTRRFTADWVWLYFLKMFIGAALALIFYFVLRGGLMVPSNANEFLNPYGVAGISGLVGLFSEKATQKLRDMFDTVIGSKK